MRKTLILTPILTALLLVGCGKTKFGEPPAPGGLSTDAVTELRGQDANENGIRDQVEAATGPMAADITERLRLLSYSWALEQGMEVGLLGDDAAVAKTAQFMADTTQCVMTTTSNPGMANHMISLYQLTTDSPLRKEAMAKLQARTNAIAVTPSDQPCAQSDALATSILKQTGDKTKARNEAEAAKAAAKAGAPTPPPAAPSAPAPTLEGSASAPAAASAPGK